ncbi:MAG: DUF2917 domain-containing protein [Betaproteobacteria bacterium]|nr:DUF2917 domain-containing protein [Betaproteobacteria bacterium]
MSKPITDYKAQPKRFELAPNQAVTIIAYRGTEVRAVQGELWITQEGDGQDYIVAAGTRFCSGHNGAIVVSALGGTSRASVSWTDPGRAGGYSRSGVWLDYGRIEQLQNAARQARASELARLFRGGLALLARAWRRTTRRRKAAAQLAIR